MKTIKFLLPLFIFGALTSCDIETPEKGITYNDTIIKITDDLDTEYYDLIDLYAEGDDYSELYDGVNKLRTKAESTKKELNDLGDFYGDASFLNTSVAYTDVIISNCDHLTEIFELEEAGDDGDRYNELFDIVDDAHDNSVDDMISVQEKFAKDHSFTIE